jgi:hypothetical protein
MIPHAKFPIACALIGMFIIFGQVRVARADWTYLYLPSEAVIHHQGNLVIDPGTVSGTYQQLFDSSLFSPAAAGGILIQTVEFRPSLSGLDGAGDLDGVRIEFSTTSKSVDSLSPVFSDNIGTDNQLFWSEGQRTRFLHGQFAAGDPFAGTMGWSPAFPVLAANGFLYDPSKGNLLMTVHNLHIPSPVISRFDGVRGSPAMASVRSSGPNAVSGTVSSDALVTLLIGVAIVPEPSTAVLLSVGLVLVCGLSRHRLNSKERNVLS